MTIIGIDPGKHVGLAVFREGDFVEARVAHGIPEVYRFLWSWKPDRIAMEDFRGGYAHTNQRDPLIMIGAVLGWAQTNKIRVSLQSPGILRLYLPKADGYHESKHARCAVAHALYYVSRDDASVSSGDA